MLVQDYFLQLAKKSQYLELLNNRQPFWTQCWKDLSQDFRIETSELTQSVTLIRLAELMWHYGLCILNPSQSHYFFHKILNETGLSLSFLNAYLKNLLDNLEKNLKDEQVSLYRDNQTSLLQQETLKRLLCAHSQENFFQGFDSQEPWIRKIQELTDPLSLAFSNQATSTEILETYLNQLEQLSIPTDWHHEALHLLNQLIEDPFLWFEWRFLSFSSFQTPINNLLLLSQDPQEKRIQALRIGNSLSLVYLKYGKGEKSPFLLSQILKGSKNKTPFFHQAFFPETEEELAKDLLLAQKRRLTYQTKQEEWGLRLFLHQVFNPFFPSTPSF